MSACAGCSSARAGSSPSRGSMRLPLANGAAGASSAGLSATGSLATSAAGAWLAGEPACGVSSISSPRLRCHNRRTASARYSTPAPIASIRFSHDTWVKAENPTSMAIISSSEAPLKPSARCSVLPSMSPTIPPADSGSATSRLYKRMASNAELDSNSTVNPPYTARPAQLSSSGEKRSSSRWPNQTISAAYSGSHQADRPNTNSRMSDSQAPGAPIQLWV